MTIFGIHFETRYIPLYILMAILVGCILYFGIKHLIEAFKEVRNKKAGAKYTNKKVNGKRQKEGSSGRADIR